MFELDFAFLKMIEQDRQGLAFRKVFLDRLAPWFFGPRVQTLVQFGRLGLKGCSVLLPLGPGNWRSLHPHSQEMIFEQSQRILSSYQVPVLAVDRSLKKQMLQLSTSFPLIFGDNFIKALATTMIRFYLSFRALKRLVVVGEMPQLAEYIETLKQFDTPVSIQNYCPARYEVMAYQLLYQKGIAVSTSYINPRAWEPGDMVIVFDSVYRKFALMAPKVLQLSLTDESRGLAPGLEASLESRGLPSLIKVIAPVLESCLLSKAGFPPTGGEQIESRKEWEVLEQVGEQIGLWDYFLDKAV